VTEQSHCIRRLYSLSGDIDNVVLLIALAREVGPNAIASVRPSVHPSFSTLTFEPSDL